MRSAGNYAEIYKHMHKHTHMDIYNKFTEAIELGGCAVCTIPSVPL